MVVMLLVIAVIITAATAATAATEAASDAVPLRAAMKAAVGKDSGEQSVTWVGSRGSCTQHTHVMACHMV